MNRISFLLVLLPLMLAAAPATQPEIRHGLPMAGSPPERSRRFFERLSILAEPTGHADPARLPSYLAVLKRELIKDPRLIAFSPTAEAKGGRIVVTGFAEYPELKDAVVKYLEVVGFPDVQDQMELVPSASLGEKRFAIVTAPTAFLYDKPIPPRETLTQAFIGDGLFLLQKDGNAYLCHSAEGYLGYVAASEVNPLDAESMRVHLSASLVTMKRDFRQGTTYLPTGAHLQQNAGSSNIDLPNGTTAAVPTDYFEPAPSVSERIEKIIGAANLMMGTRYVWGGRTADGVDCSGLIHSAYQSQGIVLPRDTDEQALCGTLVGTRTFRSALRRGDLLFFISGRGSIHHVALYLGDDQYLEAAEPVVKISSFNPKDENYSEKRDKSFGFAKRVLQ